jgi:hypothetical protein
VTGRKRTESVRGRGFGYARMDIKTNGKEERKDAEGNGVVEKRGGVACRVTGRKIYFTL